MQSMTGFATAEGVVERSGWRWDARSVNARGFEIRFRTPSGWEAEEAGWRALAAERFRRGTLHLSLSVTESSPERVLRVNRAALDAAVDAARMAQSRLSAAGVRNSGVSLDGLLSLRGVLENETAERASGPVSPAMSAAAKAGLGACLDRLVSARAAEGTRLKALLAGHVDEIERLTATASNLAAAREPAMRARLAERVAALLAAGAGVEEGRLAQEMAMIAVKADVREELDRLTAHVAAARDLLALGEPVGRKFDFLTQEFNREANTLCAKSQDAALTETGLALKVVIDQMREQAANVE